MLALRTLGQLDISGEDAAGRGPLLTQPKRLALLVYLAVPKPGTWHRRDKLLGVFWPEHDQPHARGDLRQALTFLRHTLGDDVILTRGTEEVALNPARVESDVTAFREAIDRGAWEAAVELHRGEFLAGFFLSHAPAFDEWLDATRRTLGGQYETALATLADAALVEGNPARAIEWCRRLLDHDRFNSRYAMKLMEALAAAGDPANALLVAEQHVELLREELDVAAPAELQALVDGIRRKSSGDRMTTPRLVTKAPTAPVGPITRERSRTRRVGIAALSIAILAALAGGAWLARNGSVGTVPVSPTRVAVFPFTVQASADLQYLREGVMYFLSDALDGAGDLRRVDPYALIGHLPRGTEEAIDHERARATARDFGAGHYVLGSVLNIGGRIRLSASLYDLQGIEEPVLRTTAEGDPKALSDLVYAVAAELLRHLPVGEGARLTDVTSIQTASYDALKSYLEGEALLRRGWPDSAIAQFERAVAADSGFALAWYRLSVAHGFSSWARMAPAVDRAMRHADRLSQRDRLLMESHDSWVHGDGRRSEALALEATRRYPDHVESWYFVGRARYFYAWQLGRPLFNASEPLERALLWEPHEPNTTWLTMNLAMQQGRYADADSLLVLTMRGGGAAPIRAGIPDALAYLKGDAEALDRLIRKLKDSDDYAILSAGARMSRLSDDLAAARHILGLFLDESRSESSRALGHLFRAHLEVAGGRWESARSDLAAAATVEPSLALIYGAWLAAAPFLDVPPQELTALRDSVQRSEFRTGDWGSSELRHLRVPQELGPHARTYLLGLLSARLGDEDVARRYADTLEAAADPPDSISLRRDLALEIRALAAAEAGRTEDALATVEQLGLQISHLDQVRPPLYRRAFGRFIRAESLHRLGRYDEALGWHGAWGGPWNPEDLWRAPSHLRSGEIYERLGEPQKALEEYAHFVARWSDCDPHLRPLVDDVARRMARLSGERP